MILLLTACTSTVRDSGASLDAGEAGSGALRWDLGDGLSVLAPEQFDISFSEPGAACTPVHHDTASGRGDVDILDLSIPWWDSPFGTFDLAVPFETTRSDGTAYAERANSALWLEEGYYSAYGQGQFEVTPIADNAGVRLVLRDLVYTSTESSKTYAVSAALELDIHVGCGILAPDGSEGGDGGGDGCALVNDVPPYQNAYCREATAMFPEDVKY